MPRGIDCALQRCAGHGANAVGATIALGLPFEAGIHSTEAAIAAVQAMTNAAPAVGTSDRRAFLNWVRIVGSLDDLRMSGTTYLRGGGAQKHARQRAWISTRFMVLDSIRKGVELCVGRVFDAIERLDPVRLLIALAGNIVDVIAGERAPFLFWFPLALLPVAFDRVPVHSGPRQIARIFMDMAWILIASHKLVRAVPHI
jgi:hypothetical protein